jgi:hypothetical protein
VKLALINDTHAGARGDSLIFNEYFFKFWENVFFPYLKKNGITHICHLGDLVDRRKFINYVILNSWRKRFFDVLVQNNITMDIIVGNHDVTYKNTNDINAMQELFEHYNNIRVYTESSEIEYDGLQVALVPWINSGNYQKSLDFLSKTKSQVVFGHFEISGFEMDRGNVCHDGMNAKLFDRFDTVLSGHFHHKSGKGNINYLGNQYEMTWADYGDQKGFHVFDTANRQLEYISNPYKIFHRVNYDDTVQDFDYWKKYDYEKLKECYVKIIVVNKQNPYLFDTMMDKLYQTGVIDISIVEDLTDTDIDNDIINETEDTITIIDKVVDSMQLDVEKKKLKSIIRELHIEALNVENV